MPNEPRLDDSPRLLPITGCLARQAKQEEEQQSSRGIDAPEYPGRANAGRIQQGIRDLTDLIKASVHIVP